MTSSEWNRIEDLFHATLRLDGAERAAFLRRECLDNVALQHEVESLVAASEDQYSFIEQPAVSLGLRLLSRQQASSLVGQLLGHYRIVRSLGSGGMGDVYLAEDQRLERQVALKFLGGVFVDDEWAKEQLMKEARAVAKLENPNICGVYGLEEVAGQHFIVMQFVEGETLSAALQKGILDLTQALDFSEQIVNALSAAHLRGIIHRDVKPQNIVVTPDGQIKVLDFGLAKFVRQQSSIELQSSQPEQTAHAGLVIGTAAYMSPEQTEGEELDYSSDIFSFGILFYQMLGGRNPFLRADKEKTIAAIRTLDPPPLTEVPVEVRNIVTRCLQKERADRYETTAELLVDIRSFQAKSKPSDFWSSANLRRFALAVAAVLLVVLAATSFVYVKATKVHSLAVLPIVNKSPDPSKGYLSEGLTRNLFDKFSYLPRLKVKLPNNVPAGDNAEVAQAGRRLNVDAVLHGEIFQQGDIVMLRLVLLNAKDGKPKWEQTFNLDGSNLFALQDEIISKVTSSLDIWLLGNERKLLTKRQTDSEEALRSYMKGRRLWLLKRDGENTDTAIEYLDRAIELDPAFALAYSGLADCYVQKTNVLYGLMGTREAMEKARNNAQIALDIDQSLAEPHTSMGVIELKYDWDWQKAEKELRLAIELNQDYAQAHYWYSNLLSVVGRFEEALRESEIARSLDPYSPLADMNHGRALYYARKFPEAEAHFLRMLREKPDYPQALHLLGYVLLQLGRNDDAISVFKRLHALKPLHAAAGLGHAFGKAGRRAEALKIIEELDEAAATKPLPPHEKALVYIGLGDLDEAFKLLDESSRERFAGLIYLRTDPLYDSLRSDPRYAALAQHIGLIY